MRLHVPPMPPLHATATRAQRRAAYGAYIDDLWRINPHIGLPPGVKKRWWQLWLVEHPRTQELTMSDPTQPPPGDATAQALARIEGKVDALQASVDQALLLLDGIDQTLEQLTTDADDDEPPQTTLDGEPAGAERDPAQPL